MNPNLYVVSGITDKNLKNFANLPYKLYQNDSNWVKVTEESVFSDFYINDKYLERGEKDIFIVMDNDTPVARAAVSWDKESSLYLGEPTGFFSHFESINNTQVVKIIFDEIKKWFKTRKLKKIMGPMSAKLSDTRGLLVEGSGRPLFGMPYTPPYYIELLKSVGFEKAMYMSEFIVKLEQHYSRVASFAKLVRLRYSDIKIRFFDLKNFESEIVKIVDLYNEAWQRNWGFIPLNADELYDSSHEMKELLQYSMIVEHKGKVIGFQMIMPDINQVIDVNGNVDLEKAKCLKSYRALFIGVHPKYRYKGIEALIYDELLNRICPEVGIEEIHIAWVLENNNNFRQEITNIVGKENYSCKTYGLYVLNI